MRLGPETGVALVVEVNHGIRLADLRETIDQRADEAELLHAALQLARRALRILHGEGGERAEAVGALGGFLRQKVIGAARDIGRLLRLPDRLDGRRVEREDHHLHAVRVHLAQAPLLHVDEARLELRPRAVGEESFRVRQRVGNGEVLLEANLSLHGRLLWWHVSARGDR